MSRYINRNNRSRRRSRQIAPKIHELDEYKRHLEEIERSHLNPVTTGVEEFAQAHGEGKQYKHDPAHAYYEGAGDVRYQEDKRQTPSESGSIMLFNNVIATFDSRLINGKDFTYSAFETWNITGDPPTSLTLTSTYNVPGGFNAVIRGFRYKMVPDVPIEIDSLLLSLIVDGVTNNDLQSMVLGTVINDFIPTFFLAPGGGSVVFSFSAPTGIASLTTDTRKIHIEMVGNLLIDTGAPLNLEASNIAQEQRFIGEQQRRLGD